jgi:hypothetical protein
MSRPIALSDDELTAIMNAARPLAPRDRDRFLKQIAQAIVDLPERGPGSVYRAIHATFRMHYDAPDLRTDGPRSRAY